MSPLLQSENVTPLLLGSGDADERATVASFENNTVRLHGHVIDIPKRPNSKYATYAGKDVVVKHLLSGDYRVFYGEECIAWASGSRPKPSTTSNRNNDKNDNEEVTLSPSS